MTLIPRRHPAAHQSLQAGWDRKPEGVRQLA
jgi:hypothetical protein